MEAENGLNIHKMNVKSIFCNEFMQQEVYIRQPHGYVVKGYEDKVLKLKKDIL